MLEVYRKNKRGNMTELLGRSTAQQVDPRHIAEINRTAARLTNYPDETLEPEVRALAAQQPGQLTEQQFIAAFAIGDSLGRLPDFSERPVADREMIIKRFAGKILGLSSTEGLGSPEVPALIDVMFATAIRTAKVNRDLAPEQSSIDF